MSEEIANVISSENSLDELSNYSGGKRVTLITGEEVVFRNGTRKIKLIMDLPDGVLLTQEFMIGICTEEPVRRVLLVKETRKADVNKGEKTVYKKGYDPSMVARLVGAAEELGIT